MVGPAKDKDRAPRLERVRAVHGCLASLERRDRDLAVSVSGLQSSVRYRGEFPAKTKRTTVIFPSWKKHKKLSKIYLDLWRQ